MAAYWHFVIMVVGGIETMWLSHCHTRGIIKWEPIWVVFVCWLQYILDLAVPEAQWVKPEFANGEHVDWLRICGWMATSPVLILFLVSMTTFGGREASVRVVPFLVANQVMFLAGITSAICLAPARWYIFGIAVATGLYVFLLSAVCIRSLYVSFGDQAADSDGRTLVLALGLAYFAGCGLAPIAWTCGHSGSDVCNEDATGAAYLAGDLLSKNLFVILAVVLKVRYLTDSPRTLTTLVPGLNGAKLTNAQPMRRMRSSTGSLNVPQTPIQHQTALMRTANLIGIAPAPPGKPEWDPNRADAPTRRLGNLQERNRQRQLSRRPSLGNVAIDDMSASFRNRSDDGSFRQRIHVENAFSPEREISFRDRSSSPDMAMRALRGQSGFNEGRAADSGFSVGGGGGFPFNAIVHNYAPPSQAYAPRGAPPTTPQAQSLATLLQRVQELVVAHANVPSNSVHWNAVLDGAGGKVTRVSSAEAEVASAMQKLAEAKAEVLALAVADKKDTTVAPKPVGGDDDQTSAPNSPAPPKPQLAASAWLKQEEDVGASTPASPLPYALNSPSSRRPRPFGVPRLPGSPRLGRAPNSPGLSPGSPRLGKLPRDSGKLGDIRRSGGNCYPPVEYTPRARLPDTDTEQGEGDDNQGGSRGNEPIFASRPSSCATSLPPAPSRCASMIEERVKRASDSKSPAALRKESGDPGARGWERDSRV